MRVVKLLLVMAILLMGCSKSQSPQSYDFIEYLECSAVLGRCEVVRLFKKWKRCVEYQGERYKICAQKLGLIKAQTIKKGFRRVYGIGVKNYTKHLYCISVCSEIYIMKND